MFGFLLGFGFIQLFALALSILLLLMGTFMVLHPIWFLELRDAFRTMGKVYYTDFAIIVMRIFGAITAIGGIVLFIIDIMNII